MYACHLSTQEVEARWSQVPGQFQLHKEYQRGFTTPDFAFESLIIIITWKYYDYYCNTNKFQRIPLVSKLKPILHSKLL